jgi:hypothetical protein
VIIVGIDKAVIMLLGITTVLVTPLSMSGCALSKDESTLARLHDEEQNKKKKAPAGSLKEEQVGVKYYPDADIARTREYDEGGNHVIEAILGSDDSFEKIRDFYEREIGAKNMPMGPSVSSIQADRDGKHYQVGLTHFDSHTTISITVSKPEN